MPTMYTHTHIWVCTVGLMCIYTLRTLLQTQSQKRESKSPIFIARHLILPYDPRHPVIFCLWCTVKKKGLLNDSTGSSVLDADMNTRQTLYLTVFLHTLQEVQWRYSRPSPLKQLLKKHNKTKTIVASHDIIITNAVTEQTQQYVNN